MRCYDDKQFRKSCAKLTSQKDIISAQNKNVMLITITACIFITMVLFIFGLFNKIFLVKLQKKLNHFLMLKYLFQKNKYKNFLYIYYMIDRYFSHSKI